MNLKQQQPSSNQWERARKCGFYGCLMPYTPTQKDLYKPGPSQLAQHRATLKGSAIASFKSQTSQDILNGSSSSAAVFFTAASFGHSDSHPGLQRRVWPRKLEIQEKKCPFHFRLFGCTLFTASSTVAASGLGHITPCSYFFYPPS